MNEDKEKKPFRERAKDKIKKYAPWVFGALALVGGIGWVICSADNKDETVECRTDESETIDLICDQQSVEPDREVQSEKTERAAHDVCEHVRNLPNGWNASPEKAETAADHGYDLGPGQTWVESYTTGNKTA